MGNIRQHLSWKFKQILKLKNSVFSGKSFRFFRCFGIILEYGRENTGKKEKLFPKKKPESFKFAIQDSKRMETVSKRIEKG